MCHVSHFFFFFLQFGEAYRWGVCYQRGLPRLVFNENTKNTEKTTRTRTGPQCQETQNTLKTIKTEKCRVKNNIFKPKHQNTEKNQHLGLPIINRPGVAGAVLFLMKTPKKP